MSSQLDQQCILLQLSLLPIKLQITVWLKLAHIQQNLVVRANKVDGKDYQFADEQRY